MQSAWQDGLAAICPSEADPIEWRASARRLAKHLECRVRTGMGSKRAAGNDTGGHAVIAEANDGFPLGLIDPYERDAWLRQVGAESP